MTKSNGVASSERAAAQALSALEAQRAALSDAQREIGDLRRRRHEMLASASVEEIQDADATIVCAATRVEIAEARLAVQEGELERLRKAAREARTAADLDRVRELAEEKQRLISTDYAQAAATIATTLARIAEIETELFPLRLRLPSGAPDVRIEPVNVYRPSLGSFVKLPGVAAGDPAFWPRHPRRLRLDEIYARN